MNVMYKIASAVLAALLLIAMTNCSDNADIKDIDTAAPDSEAQTEVTNARSDVEVNNYEGYVFKIVSTNQNDRQTDFIAVEENGDTLNDLVFRRNMHVEETYNIAIEATGMDFGSLNSLIQKMSARETIPTTCICPTRPRIHLRRAVI